MSKEKVLGKQYGVTVTRPFSKEMYAYNDIVAVEAKDNIRKAINNRRWTVEELNEMTKSITGYTFAMHNREEVREEMLNEVDNLQNWWLAQEYPTLVKEGFCKPLKTGFVGFDKLR